MASISVRLAKLEANINTEEQVLPIVYCVSDDGIELGEELMILNASNMSAEEARVNAYRHFMPRKDPDK